MIRNLYILAVSFLITVPAVQVWAEDKTPENIYSRSLNEAGQTPDKAAGCLTGDCETANMWGGELHRYTAKPIKTRVEQYLPANPTDEQKNEEVK